MLRFGVLGLCLSIVFSVMACTKEPDFKGTVDKHRALVRAKLDQIDAVAKKADMPQDAQVYGFKSPDPPAVWTGATANAVVLMKGDLADVSAVSGAPSRPTVPEDLVRAAKALEGDFGTERTAASLASLEQALTKTSGLLYLIVVQAGAPSEKSFVGVAQIWDLASAKPLGAYPLQAHAPDGKGIQKNIDEALVTEMAKAIKRAG